MPEARPAHHPQPFHHLTRIATAAVAVGAAAAFLAFDLRGIPRVVAVVASVALFQWISESRVTRQLSRMERQMEARLEASIYAEGYVDGIQRRPPDGVDVRRLHSV